MKNLINKFQNVFGYALISQIIKYSLLILFLTLYLFFGEALSKDTKFYPYYVFFSIITFVLLCLIIFCSYYFPIRKYYNEYLDSDWSFVLILFSIISLITFSIVIYITKDGKLDSFPGLITADFISIFSANYLAFSKKRFQPFPNIYDIFFSEFKIFIYSVLCQLSIIFSILGISSLVFFIPLKNSNIGQYAGLGLFIFLISAIIPVLWLLFTPIYTYIFLKKIYKKLLPKSWISPLIFFFITGVFPILLVKDLFIKVMEVELIYFVPIFYNSICVFFINRLMYRKHLLKGID